MAVDCKTLWKRTADLPGHAICALSYEIELDFAYWAW
jgi:hypothetical protein